MAAPTPPSAYRTPARDRRRAKRPGRALQFTTSEPASGYAPVGTYTITPSGLASSNYSVAFVAGTLTVNPAALTVTANAASSIYGAPIPSFTYTLSGFAAARMR